MRFLFTVLILLSFFLSSYGLAVGGSAIFNFSMYATLFIMILMLLFYKKIKIEYNKILIFLILLYVFTLNLSALYNSQVGIILNAYSFLLMFLSTTVIAYTYLSESLGKILISTLLISHIPILMIPLVGGIESFPYRGMFENSNAFGLVAATIFAVFLAILLSILEKNLFYKEKTTKMKTLAYIFLATISFTLVTISASRTSFLAVVASILVGMFFIFILSIKHKMTINVLFKLILGLPLILSLYFIINIFLPISLYIKEIILDKFSAKSSDFLDGRGYVWEGAIRDAKLLGYGNGYFEETFGIGPHNTFIYVLGTYGWLAMIIFSLIILVGLYYSIKYILSENGFKFLPIIMMVTFLTLSMGENLFHKVTMLATLMVIGLVSNNRKLLVTKTSQSV